MSYTDLVDFLQFKLSGEDFQQAETLLDALLAEIDALLAEDTNSAFAEGYNEGFADAKELQE